VGAARAGRAAPTVLVAVDTSGSMTSEEIVQIAGEVDGMVRRGFRVACV
jgi:predicted metal-dependent peptidase